MLEKLINGYFLIVKNTLMPFRRVLLPTLSYRFHYKSSILAWNEILFERYVSAHICNYVSPIQGLLANINASSIQLK